MGYLGGDHIILSTLLKYDLHVHSKYSMKCGILEPYEIIKHAMTKGLNGIAITDHDTIKGGLECKKYETDSLKVIVGCELNTRQGEIIGLFLNEEIRSREINEAIDEIHAQGGLVTVPHPFDTMRRSTLKHMSEHVGKIDAIEVFNARCIFDKSNNEALEFARKQRIPATAGSDAHYANEIGLAGVYISGSSKDGILNNNFNIFSGKSPLLSHLKTKTHKLLKYYEI